MPLDTQGQLLNVLERSDQVRTTETDGLCTSTINPEYPI